MSNQKLTQLNALTSVNSLDLTYIVDDPSGTPLSKKSTISDVLKSVNTLSALTSVNSLDIAYIIDNPSGSPLSKKCTTLNLVKGGASSGAVADLIDSTLTASKNLVSDESGKITTTENTYCRWRGTSAGDPGSNQAGDVFKDTNDSNKIKIYDGSDYISLT